MSNPIKILLPVIEELDSVLGESIPAGDVTLRGIENGELIAYAPGPVRGLENLWLARGTLSSIYLLGRNTAESEADHTEEMAILARRLLDLAAQTTWLTDYEPPDREQLPADPGSSETLLEDGDPVAWPSDFDRFGFAACLCAATEWVDVQALRSQLAELREQKKTGTEIVSAYEDVEHQQSARRRLGMLVDQERMIGLRLTQLGAPITPRVDTVSILTKKAPDLVILWRTESDTAHGGAFGRQMQRGTGNDPQIGAPAEPWRQALVLTVAIDSVIRLAVRALAVLGVDDSQLRAFAPRAHEAFDEARKLAGIGDVEVVEETTG